MWYWNAERKREREWKPNTSPQRKTLHRLWMPASTNRRLRFFSLGLQRLMRR